jgi:hypothetical protein
MKKLSAIVALTIASIGAARAEGEPSFTGWSTVAFCPHGFDKTIVCSESRTWVNAVQATYVGSIRVVTTFSGPDYMGTESAQNAVYLLDPFSWTARVITPQVGYLAICAHSGWHYAQGTHSATAAFPAPPVTPPQATYQAALRAYCDCGDID